MAGDGVGDGALRRWRRLRCCSPLSMRWWWVGGWWREAVVAVAAAVWVVVTGITRASAGVHACVRARAMEGEGGEGGEGGREGGGDPTPNDL